MTISTMTAAVIAGKMGGCEYWSIGDSGCIDKVNGAR
jgi:hypothetical protein